MQVTCRFDAKDAVNKLNAIKANLGDRCLTRTVNEVAKKAKTQMSSVIRDTYNVRADLVRERLQVRLAVGGRNATFTAYVVGNAGAKGRDSLNFIRFIDSKATIKAFKRGHDMRLDQLRFTIKKSKPGVIHKGAFVGNQGRTVFERTGKPSARNPKREGIKPVYSIGVLGMFSTRKNIAEVQRQIMVEMPVIMQRNVRYYLSTVR